MEAAIRVDVSELAAPSNDIRAGNVEIIGECEASSPWERAIGREVFDSR
jgi:hypothetical protein